MSEKKSSWDDIPTINGLEVDWQFEPDSSQDKRTKVRLLQEDLQNLLGKKHVGVKVAAKNSEYNASLMDISQIGLAIYIKEAIQVDTPLRFGLLLGKQKIIAKALVRNTIPYEEGFRVGIEFVDLDIDSENYIAGLVSSRLFTHR